MKLNRRSLVASAAAAFAALPMAAGAQQGSPRSGRKAIFVLVHGGGHGGWCWKRVADPLRAAGHAVYAPSLTGLADRSHLLTPDIDLDTHIADIVNLLKWEDLTDVILVGHSYGGMVITGIADRAPERVGQLVYLDAAHPKNGESLFKRPEASRSGEGAGGSGSAAGAPTLVNGVELLMFPNEQLIHGALGVTDPRDVKWLMEKLTPHPAKAFYQPLRLQNEAAVRRIRTTDIWRTPVLAQLRKSGAPFTHAQTIWEIDSTSHNLMITEPKQVTDMLLKLTA